MGTLRLFLLLTTTSIPFWPLSLSSCSKLYFWRFYLTLSLSLSLSLHEQFHMYENMNPLLIIMTSTFQKIPPHEQLKYIYGRIVYIVCLDSGYLSVEFEKLQNYSSTTSCSIGIRVLGLFWQTTFPYAYPYTHIRYIDIHRYNNGERKWQPKTIIPL